MEVARLNSLYRFFYTLFDEVKNKTTWENFVDFIEEKYFTKNGVLRKNNWRHVKFLRKHGFQTIDDLQDAVEFWNNNIQKYNWERDENNKLVCTGLKDKFRNEKSISHYYDYLDYMNEVVKQEEEFNNQMKEEFDDAAKQAYEEQSQWKIDDLFKKEINDFEPVNPFEEKDQVEISDDDFDKEQELQYCEILKDKNNFEKGITIYLNKNKKVRFSVFKPYLISFLDSIQDLDKWCFKYYIEAFNKGEWRTVPLNSDNIPRIRDFLESSFRTRIDNMIQDYYHEAGQEVRFANYSDPADPVNDIQITVDMCNVIQITPIAFGNRRSETEIYCDNGGAFYDSIIKEEYSYLEQFTSRYQIFSNLLNENNEPREEFNLNCLLFAFKKSNKIDDKTLTAMKSRCFTRIVSFKQVCKLCNDFKIKLTIKKFDKSGKLRSVQHNKKYYGYLGNDSIAIIDLILIRKHYFLNETINGLTSYYINNIDKVNQWCFRNNHPFEYGFKISGFNKSGKAIIDNRRTSIKSYHLIELLEKQNLVRKLTFSDRSIFQSDLHHYIKPEIDQLSIHENDFKKIEYKEKKQHNIPRVFYADCESDVSGNTHKAFYIAWCERGSDTIYGAFGENCIEEFLKAIPDGSIVYFHNLGYDARLMNNFNIKQSIDKGTRVMSEDITYEGKTIKLKDSFSILSMSLSKFPKTFNLECGEKEMFPYKYYTFERLKSNRGIISEAGSEEIAFTWNQETFENNLKRINADNGDGTFDMIKYVEFYCKQDVRILQQGFDKFRYITLNGPISMDVDDYLSAPAIANAYFRNHIYTKANDMYEYSGITREFIQQCIYGGRCMTRDNQKWDVKKQLNDFDAVSLYPSAMRRLYIVNGKPQVMTKEMLNVDYLLKHTADEQEQISNEKFISAYCVHINITKVGINRHFPLIVKKDPITKTNRNVNECCEMHVDNIMLEDLIKYQGIECEIISGLYWTDEKDFSMQEIIQKLHELRCEYKITKNPMQEIIKLIMNSAYGKTIQKPIKTNTVYKKVQSLKRYYHKYGKDKQETSKSKIRFEKHKNQIKKDSNGKEYIELQVTPAQSFIEKNHAKIREAFDINTNLVGITVNNQIDDFSTPTLVGVQILSMSKRLMNEVMCTAEDNNIPIYYQDTDSMHIENDLIPLLEIKYRERFNRELIGKNLGQFHSDFEPLIDGGNNPVSVRFIGVGKKCYIDELHDDQGNIGYHIRMKGITGSCIELDADRKFKGDKIALYRHLFDGKSLTFNLNDVKAKFKNNKNRTISNLNNFKRTVKFIGECNEVN